MEDVIGSVLGIGAADAARIALAVPLLYVAVVLFVRLSGKRTTGQMNGFDWIVTVALGSLVASGVLPGGASASEAGLAIGLLMALQWIVTWTVRRSATVRSMVKATPQLVLRKGEFVRDAMRAERLTEAEVRAAVREAGHTRVEDVEWVILETDATLSVALKTDPDGPRTALEGVAGVSGPEGRPSPADRA